MQVKDFQKVLNVLQETVSDSVEHFAGRFEKGAEKLGEEYVPLAEFAAVWRKLSKESRKLFVEQLLKSAGLVVASIVATRAGLKTAWKSQKQVRNVLLTFAEIIEPTVKKVKKEGKKVKKNAKKKLKKATE